MHDQQAALFGNSGQPLDLSSEAAKQFTYLLERPDRSLELATPEEFEKRWKAPGDR